MRTLRHCSREKSLEFKKHQQRASRLKDPRSLKLLKSLPNFHKKAKSSLGLTNHGKPISQTCILQNLQQPANRPLTLKPVNSQQPSFTTSLSWSVNVLPSMWSRLKFRNSLRASHSSQSGEKRPQINEQYSFCCAPDWYIILYCWLYYV